MHRSEFLLKIRFHDFEASPLKALDEKPWEWQLVHLTTGECKGGFTYSFEEAQAKFDWFFS